MRKIALFAAIVMVLPVIAPAQAQTMPQGRSYNSGDYNQGFRPGNKPSRQRFICVLDRNASNGGRQTSCPTDAGRVGGRCRCEGAIGSGTRQSY